MAVTKPVPAGADAPRATSASVPPDPVDATADAPGGLAGAETDEGEDASDQGHEWRALTTGPSEHGLRLDKVLVSLAGEFSRSHLQQLVARGHVWLDDRVETTPARKLRAGQQLRVELVPTAESQAFRPEPMALDIVHEDRAVLVVHKPAGLVVHPAAGNWSGTLLNGLLAHHAGAAQLPRAGIVHRLDKDTSGLMVVGKTLAAVTALSRLIAAREVHREYLALVHGRIDAPYRVDLPLRRDPVSRVKMAVAPAGLGKPARTDVFPLGVGEVGGRAVSAVHCVLHTGRTHQIRVHLAQGGHPLLADALYGGAAALGLGRQALHAARLSLVHPVSGAALRWHAPLPPDLASAWQQMGAAMLAD